MQQGGAASRVLSQAIAVTTMQQRLPGTVPGKQGQDMAFADPDTARFLSSDLGFEARPADPGATAVIAVDRRGLGDPQAQHGQFRLVAVVRLLGRARLPTWAAPQRDDGLPLPLRLDRPA